MSRVQALVWASCIEFDVLSYRSLKREEYCSSGLPVLNTVCQKSGSN